MLNLPSASLYWCVAPTDLRKSFDSLAALVQEHLKHDPLSGSWFIFCNKRADKMKILYWDKDGYAIWQKRLEKGCFERPRLEGDARSVSLSANDLALILGGIDLTSAKRRQRFKLERQAG